METNDFSLFKYFKGEEFCPEHFKTDERSKFWYGESMFFKTHQSIDRWEKDGQDVLNELKEKDIDKYNIAAKLTSKQLGVVMYIEILFGKWNPYDDLGWIFKY